MTNTFDATEDLLTTADLPCNLPSDNCWDVTIGKGGLALLETTHQSSGEPGTECPSFHWSGNTTLGSTVNSPNSPEEEEFRPPDSSQDIAILNNTTPIHKEESWMMKTEISAPLSPITPVQPVNPCNFSMDGSPADLNAPRLPTAPTPFPLEHASSNAEEVLHSMLSPVEGGTVEATLDDIDLSDINYNGDVGLTSFNNGVAPVAQQKRQEAVDEDSNHITFEMALNASNGNPLLDPMLADFAISGAQGGTPSYTDSMDLDIDTLGSTVTSGKDVMARAVIAAASAAADGSREDRARPWACELCPSRFSIKGHLSQHNRYVHEKYRPHRCPKSGCSASFGTRFARSQHVWTVHERKKPFLCEEPGCKASFGQRSHLNRHRKRHRTATEDPEGLDGATVEVEKAQTQPRGKLSAAKPITKSKKKRAPQSRPHVGGVSSHVARNIFGHLPPSSFAAGSIGSRDRDSQAPNWKH